MTRHTKEPWRKHKPRARLVQIALERHFGQPVITGYDMHTGERVKAALWAVTARPGDPEMLQVAYTDRGAYKTGLNAYQLFSVLS